MNMARKTAPKKPKTHKRKRHAIDHEWLDNAFRINYLQEGESMASIAKRYVRVKKTSTVGSITAALAVKKKAREAELNEARKARRVIAIAEARNTLEKQKEAQESDAPQHFTVRHDSPTLKSLQDKADYHLSQYKSALKEILEVIGGEQ
jgi:hypothetical protein